MIRPKNFESLRQIHEACIQGGLRWSVAYDEVSDNWTFDISGPAAGESFHIKKTADFDDGVRRCLEHLQGLGYAQRIDPLREG